MVIEWREQRHAETAIGHRIEQAVARSGKEELLPQRESVHSGHSVSESEDNDDKCQESSKGE